MRLLIFPGGGSPDDPAKYSKVYQLLKDSAKDYGYSSVDTSVRWPGHISLQKRSNGVLTLAGATKVAHKILTEFEELNKPYDILARSFGAYVALQAAMDSSYRNLRRMILWGSPPLWYMWQLFERELRTTKTAAKKKGLVADSSLYPSLMPVEWLLQNTPCKVILATGALDKVSSASFHRYLMDLARSGNRDVEFLKPVEGVGHEVTGDEPRRVVQKYLKTVLGSRGR